MEQLEHSIEVYNWAYSLVTEKAEKLFNIRLNSGEKVIKPVEEYINQLANSPKEFNKSFSNYKVEFEIFNDLVEAFNAESIDTTVKAGVVAGAGTAALMPSVALGIATTFGTASTGTAISSLTGAAASKAALAWLGGGALAKGGAGIVGGKALLALAGPIGIGIGAVSVIGGGLLASSKNKKSAMEINEKDKEIQTQTKVLYASEKEVDSLIDLTNTHQEGILRLLNELKVSGGKNYSEFSVSEKEKVGALINHMASLSSLLNKKVS